MRNNLPEELHYVACGITPAAHEALVHLAREQNAQIFSVLDFCSWSAVSNQFLDLPTWVYLYESFLQRRVPIPWHCAREETDSAAVGEWLAALSDRRLLEWLLAVRAAHALGLPGARAPAAVVRAALIVLRRRAPRLTKALEPKFQLMH